MTPEELGNAGNEEKQEIIEVPQEKWQELQARIRDLLKPEQDRLLERFSDIPVKGNAEMVYINHELKTLIYQIAQQIFYTSSLSTFFPNEKDVKKSVQDLLETDDGEKVKEAILCGIYYTVKKARMKIRFENDVGFLGTDFEVTVRGEEDTHLSARKKIEEIIGKNMKIIQFRVASGLERQEPMEVDDRTKEIFKRLFEQPITDEKKLRNALIFFFNHEDPVLSAIIKYSLGGKNQFKETCNELLDTTLKEELSRTLTAIKAYQSENLDERVATEEELQHLQEETQRLAAEAAAKAVEEAEAARVKEAEEAAKAETERKRKMRETKQGLPRIKKPPVGVSTEVSLDDGDGQTMQASTSDNGSKTRIRKRQETKPLLNLAFGSQFSGVIDSSEGEVTKVDIKPVADSSGNNVESQLPVDETYDGGSLRDAEKTSVDEMPDFGLDSLQSWKPIPYREPKEPSPGDTDPFDIKPPDSDIVGPAVPALEDMQLQEDVGLTIPESMIIKPAPRELGPGVVEYDYDPEDTDLPDPVSLIRSIKEDEDSQEAPLPAADPLLDEVEEIELGVELPAYDSQMGDSVQPELVLKEEEPEEEEEPKTPSKIMGWLRRNRVIVSILTVVTIGVSAIGYSSYKGCGADDGKSKKPTAAKKLAKKGSPDAGVRSFKDIRTDLDAGTAAKMDAASKDIQDSSVKKPPITKQPTKVATKSPTKAPTKAPKLVTVKSAKRTLGLTNIDSDSLNKLKESGYKRMFSGEGISVDEMPDGIVSAYMEKHLKKNATRAEKRAHRAYLKKLEKGWLMYMKSLELNVETKLLKGEHVSDKDMAEYEWFKHKYSKSHKKRYRNAGKLLNKYNNLKDKASKRAKRYKKLFKMGKKFMQGLHDLNPHINSVNDVKPGTKVWFSKKIGKGLKVLKTLLDWAKAMGKTTPKEVKVTSGEVHVDNPEFMFAANELIPEPSVEIDVDYTKDLQSQGDTVSQSVSGSIDCDTGLSPISGEINVQEDAQSLVKGVVQDIRKVVAANNIDDYYADYQVTKPKTPAQSDTDNYYEEYQVEKPQPVQEEDVDDYYEDYQITKQKPKSLPDTDNYYAEYNVIKPEPEEDVDDYYEEYQVTKPKAQPEPEVDNYYAEYQVEKSQPDSEPEIDNYYAEYQVSDPEIDDYYEDYQVTKPQPVAEPIPEPASKGLWGRFKNKARGLFRKKVA